MVKDPRAFYPFGTGSYGCPGKSLALVEMKIVLVSILDKFEVKKPKSLSWMYLDRKVNQEWKDCLTTQAAHIELCFVERA